MALLFHAMRLSVSDFRMAVKPSCSYFLMIFINCVHHHSAALQQSQKLNQFMRLFVFLLGGSPVKRLKPVIPVKREVSLLVICFKEDNSLSSSST